MRIGIPRERKPHEKRVALTPDGARALCLKGWTVLVETQAGAGSNFLDYEYQQAGALIVPTLEQVWENADILMKVKEPSPEEYPLLREDLIVFSFLHPAASEELTRELLKSKVIGIDYDLVERTDRSLPILEPMSKIAGQLSIQCGAQTLLTQNGGPGLLLGGDQDLPKVEVLIIGAGISGTQALQRAYALGASITVFDINQKRLDELKRNYPDIKAIYSNSDSVKSTIKSADLIIGAVLIPGAKAPQILNRELLRTCKKDAVFVDISIDQGGISETSRATTLTEPTYIEEGIIHYCVANMPSMVPRTATLALTKVTLPYLIKLGEKPLKEVLLENEDLRKSLVCSKGILRNKAIADSFNLPFSLDLLY